MSITAEFLNSLGFQWNDRISKYTKTFHFGTISIGHTHIVWFGGYRIGRYKTQDGLAMLMNGFLAAEK